MTTSADKALKKLTPKQHIFVSEYVQSHNGVSATRAAGYKGSDQTLRSVAHENLTKPHIKDAIEALIKPALEEAQINTEKIIGELKLIAFAPASEVPLSNKISALKLLGDYLGMWNGNKKDESIKPSLNFHCSPNWTPDEARRALLEFLRNQ